MNILGINGYHGDSAAALLIDGQIVAAVEEERFNRIKHWSGFPSEAICYCLREAGLSLADLDHVAVNRDPRASRFHKLAYLIRRRPSWRLVRDRTRNAAAWRDLPRSFQQAFPGERLQARLHHIEHHRAHAASTFLLGPFEEAAILSVDGFGDFTSTLLAIGQGAVIRDLRRVRFPHSLGLFYQAVTQHLGFPQYGDEYKAMGLAPYGEPTRLDAMQSLAPSNGRSTFQLDTRYFRHASEEIGYTWLNQAPSVGRILTPAADHLLGPARDPVAPIEDQHRDLARSMQAHYERLFFSLARELAALTRLRQVVIAGGCGMNSVANGKVLQNTDFTQVYIPPAPGDSGGAVGAAAWVWSGITGRRPEPMTHAYLGPGYDEGYVGRLLERTARQWEAASVRVRRFETAAALCEATAGWIADGLVVGWYQGRMEWGPRALGNRSILCDPRRANMKDILNRKIKRRESFRPFAPSILRECTALYFETDDDVPFMSQVLVVRSEKRAEIPAVVHVDGTGRLQTVRREENPLYWSLIDAFRRRTGVPLVLNTSFNENEPIVNRPEEALDCFLRTAMDVLVLHDRALVRCDGADTGGTA